MKEHIQGASYGPGSREPSPTVSAASGFDPSREASALAPWERRYLLCTPLQYPADAGVIAYRAGDRQGGGRFAGFARRQAWLFQRMPNGYGTAFDYRLSEDGAAVAQAIRDSEGDNS